MNAAVHDVRATRARVPADFVAAERVAGMNADADDVAGLDRCRIEKCQGFVDQYGIAVAFGRGAGQDVQPARRDDGGAERDMAGIDQMNFHARVAPFEGAWAVSRSRAEVAEGRS